MSGGDAALGMEWDVLGEAVCVLVRGTALSKSMFEIWSHEQSIGAPRMAVSGAVPSV